MQLQFLFLSFLLSSVVIAKGHGGGNSTKEITDKSLCKDMRKLTKIVDTAANATKLADKTDNNATKIAAYQAKASEASAKLTTMFANATLVSTCAIINSVEATKGDCEDMEHLQELIDLVGNATAIEAKTNGNTTKIERLKAKAEKATAELAVLQSNATLMTECANYAAAKAARKAAKNNETAATGAEKATTSGSAGAVNANVASLVDARVGILFTAVLVVVGTFAL